MGGQFSCLSFSPSLSPGAVFLHPPREAGVGGVSNGEPEGDTPQELEAGLVGETHPQEPELLRRTLSDGDP